MKPIDADRFSRRLVNYANDCMEEGDRRAAYIFQDVVFELQDEPAIDPKDLQPHGRWNDINPKVLNPDIAWVCRCSLCGCPQDHKHNYCPNCGAKMDEEQSDNGRTL